MNCSGCNIAEKHIAMLERNIEDLEIKIRCLKMPMVYTFMGYSETELMKIIEEYLARNPKLKGQA